MRNMDLLLTKRQNDTISVGNRLESPVDLSENRICGDCHRLFSGDLLCQKSHETFCDSKRASGRTSHHASRASSYSGRLLSVAFV